MDGAIGVVTLSWGGFRCRLEGFEEPMAVLADALGWLAGAEPETGRGPVTTRGVPPGVRREYRNGALVLRPTEPAEAPRPAPEPRDAAPDEEPAPAPDPALGTFLGAARGWSGGPRAAPPDVAEWLGAADEPEDEGAPEPGMAVVPASAGELFDMGLGPDDDAAPPRGAADADGLDHEEAVRRLIHSQGAEAAPDEPPPPRRARRVVRPSGAAR